jgi:hypothetical protein
MVCFFNCRLYNTSSLPNLFNMKVVSVFKYYILEFISKVYLSINLLNIFIKILLCIIFIYLEYIVFQLIDLL